MLRSVKVAIPFTALRIVVPERVTPLAFAPIVMVMTVLAVVTVLPAASCTATCTPGVTGLPASVRLGCTVKASFVAAALMSNPALVAPVKPVAVALRV